MLSLARYFSNQVLVPEKMLKGNGTEVIPSGIHDEWGLFWLQAGNKVSTLVRIRGTGVKEEVHLGGHTGVPGLRKESNRAGVIKNVGAKAQRVQRLIVLSWTCCWMCISVQGWPTSQKWADTGRASSPVHLAYGVLLAPLGLRANSPHFITLWLSLCDSPAETVHLSLGLEPMVL